MDTSTFWLSFVLLLVFICLIVLMEWRRNRRLKAKEKPVVTVDELTEQFGEPDDVIVVNPTQGNSSEGVVLVYNEGKFFVINGEKVLKGQISDVSFANYANPYLPSDYMIQIYTTLQGGELMKIPTNNPSPVYAKEIVQQIRELL